MDRYERFLEAMHAYNNAQELSEPLETDYRQIAHYTELAGREVKKIKGLSASRQKMIILSVILLVFDPKSLYTDSRFKYGFVKELSSELQHSKHGTSRNLKNVCNTFRKRYSSVRKHAFQVYEAMLQDR